MYILYMLCSWVNIKYCIKKSNVIEVLTFSSSRKKPLWGHIETTKPSNGSCFGREMKSHISVLKGNTLLNIVEEEQSMWESLSF